MIDKLKLKEEAEELAEAVALKTGVVHEAADLLFFISIALAKSGVRFEDVVSELERRTKRVRRRHMINK